MRSPGEASRASKEGPIILKRRESIGKKLSLHGVDRISHDGQTHHLRVLPYRKPIRVLRRAAQGIFLQFS